MKWIEALKIYNQSKGMWCIPKKGTEDYNEVIGIMNSTKKIGISVVNPYIKTINTPRTKEQIQIDRDIATKQARAISKAERAQVRKTGSDSYMTKADIKKLAAYEKQFIPPAPSNYVGSLITTKKKKVKGVIL
jgi:hypothetical protein